MPDSFSLNTIWEHRYAIKSESESTTGVEFFQLKELHQSIGTATENLGLSAEAPGHDLHALTRGNELVLGQDQAPGEEEGAPSTRRSRRDAAL